MSRSFTSCFRGYRWLTRYIWAHRLPGLRAQVAKQRKATASELETLPARLRDPPSIEIINLVSNYLGELDRYVQGVPGYEGLIQKCTPAYKKFAEDTLRTAPNIIPKERDGVLGESIESVPYSVADNGIVDVAAPATSELSVRDMGALEYKASNNDNDDNVSDNEPSDSKTTLGAHWQEPVYLDDLRSRIERYVIHIT